MPFQFTNLSPAELVVATPTGPLVLAPGGSGMSTANTLTPDQRLAQMRGQLVAVESPLFAPVALLTLSIDLPVVVPPVPVVEEPVPVVVEELVPAVASPAAIATEEGIALKTNRRGGDKAKDSAASEPSSSE